MLNKMAVPAGKYEGGTSEIDRDTMEESSAYKT